MSWGRRAPCPARGRRPHASRRGRSFTGGPPSRFCRHCEQQPCAARGVAGQCGSYQGWRADVHCNQGYTAQRSTRFGHCGAFSASCSSIMAVALSQDRTLPLYLPRAQDTSHALADRQRTVNWVCCCYEPTAVAAQPSPNITAHRRTAGRCPRLHPTLPPSPSHRRTQIGGRATPTALARHGAPDKLTAECYSQRNNRSGRRRVQSCRHQIEVLLPLLGDLATPARQQIAHC
eukprot:COSAG01_NODE_144_length_24108_cov_11.490441_14_plen_232_part_00